MRISYSDTYQCDLCGATATVPTPASLANLTELPRPAGWVIDSVAISTAMHTRHPDVCATCAQLPYGEVLARLRATLA